MAQIFGKFLIPKNVVTWMPESSRFKTPFLTESVDVSQTMLKSPRQQFYRNFPLIQDKLS